MRVAIACDGMFVSPSVGKASNFMCYTIDKGVITSLHNLPNRAESVQQQADLVKDLQFDALIAGQIDQPLMDALAGTDIDFVGGLSGEAHDAIKDYLNARLLKLNHEEDSSADFDGGDEEASDRATLDRLADDIIREVS